MFEGFVHGLCFLLSLGLEGPTLEWFSSYLDTDIKKFFCMNHQLLIICFGCIYLIHHQLSIFHFMFHLSVLITESVQYHYGCKARLKIIPLANKTLITSHDSKLCLILSMSVK